MSLLNPQGLGLIICVANGVFDAYLDITVQIELYEMFGYKCYQCSTVISLPQDMLEFTLLSCRLVRLR